LLGASLRLVFVGTLGLAAALAYGLWYRNPSVPTVVVLSLNAGDSTLFESHIVDRDRPSESSGPELASATEYNIPSRTAALPRKWAAALAVSLLTPADTAQRRARPADVEADPDLDEPDSPPDPDELTAIYDIAAHTVYLPNGTRLEAHSGLGRMLDDPRFVSIRNRGATPPNVYDLSLRERRFHGVRALRLTPVGAGKMFGRDGILAHTYMLGAQGQSNGCVVFSDYPAFLKAYLNGEVTRLMVVDRLPSGPNPRIASRRIPETVKALFGRSAARSTYDSNDI